MYRNKLLRLSHYSLILIFLVVFTFPLYWLAVNSLQPLFSSSKWLPVHFTLYNFHLAFTLKPYFRYFANSCILAAITVTLPIISSFFSGFAFARLRGKFKGYIFMLILSTMMVPQLVTLIPQFVLLHEYNLLGTFWPWIIGYIGGSPFLIFLYRQFFMNIPKELDDAARIDGCSTYGIIIRVYMPISLPVIATAAILQFNFSWGGDFLAPYMFLKDTQFPLATALLTLDYTLPNMGEVFLPQVQEAAIFIFVLPVLIVFLFGQRYLVSGILTGAVKS
jgi:multiple sugar transport system permease protein